MKLKLLIALALNLLSFFYLNAFAQNAEPQKIIKIAIANYGSHPTLNETIAGLKEGLASAGYKEGINISYEISDVSFQPTLIRQMLTKLNANHPKVMVVLTTPVAQAAKHMLKHTPLVFSDITDPVAADLIKDKFHGEENISGATDQQDLNAFILFAKKILPNAKTIGMLYASGEDNDHALVKMMQEKAKAHDMALVSIPIDNPQDIPQRARLFKHKVDLIYVGASGPIQPSLPAIVAVANTLKIPVFNVDASAVKDNQVLGSFGVSYRKVGMNTAKIVAEVLHGKKLENIPPIYPKLADHEAFISQKKADELNIKLPDNLKNVTVIQQ